MKIFSFFRNPSENRTQFFIIMGFIILPVLAMIYVFFEQVVANSDHTSQRMKIPPQIIQKPEQDTMMKIED